MSLQHKWSTGLRLLLPWLQNPERQYTTLCLQVVKLYFRTGAMRNSWYVLIAETIDTDVGWQHVANSCGAARYQLAHGPFFILKTDWILVSFLLPFLLSLTSSYQLKHFSFCLRDPPPLLYPCACACTRVSVCICMRFLVSQKLLSNTAVPLFTLPGTTPHGRSLTWPSHTAASPFGSAPLGSARRRPAPSPTLSSPLSIVGRPVDTSPRPWLRPGGSGQTGR